MILFLKPYFEIKPWAGNELNKMFDCPDHTGEAWIVSGYKNKSSIITNGRYKGQTLRHVWNKHPELFGDFKEKEFPLLLKLISSSDKLSVQVHPNDDYALKTKNSLGKFECWYILPETKAKSITVGINLKNQIELKDVLNKGLIEQYLINKDIKNDDLIIVEPGTVHAIHEDTFLLEVQESSDITYRLYDYNRLPARALHIEDSLNVIDFNNSKNRIHNFKEQDTFKNSHFNMYKLIVNGTQDYENKGFEIFYIISGEGKINDSKIKKGDSFILTANTSKITFSGNLEIMAVIPKEKSKERLRMRKIALITGVTNQDGYYLTKLLLEKNYEVHGLIQSKSQAYGIYTNKFKNNENYFLHIGDLTDGSNLNRIIETVKPDEVYHLASQSHVDISFDMPEYTTEVNSLGTLRLLDAVKNSEIRTKIFCLSSPYIFSGEVYPQNEETLIDPKSPYAISKVFAYQMCKCYRETNNLYVVSGICYNHESPIRDKSFVSMKIIDHLKNNKNEVLELGNLDARREWGHTEDYANAIWLSLQQDKPEDYVISTGEAFTIREFVTLAYDKVGIKLNWVGTGLDEVAINTKTNEVMVKVNSKYLRPNDAKVLVGDSTKFISKTGYQFKYDINKLIDSLMEG
mgnify:FL=1